MLLLVRYRLLLPLPAQVRVAVKGVVTLTYPSQRLFDVVLGYSRVLSPPQNRC